MTDIATSSSYYGDPSIRPPRQVGPGYGSPPPVPVPDQNCYVETPCTRYRHSVILYILECESSRFKLLNIKNNVHCVTFMKILWTPSMLMYARTQELR